MTSLPSAPTVDGVGLPQLRPAVLLLVAGLALPIGLNDYQIQVVWVAFYLAVMASSWNLVAGYGGLFALGHHALATLAAYSSAGVVLALGMPVWLGVAAGTAVAALSGYLLGAATLHLRGVYFAIATWVFGEIVRQLLTINYQITRGAMGLPVPTLFSGLDPIRYYYLFLILLVLVVLSIAFLLNTRLGYCVQAVRDDEELAIASGVNAAQAKRRVFLVSAAIAGLSGCLYGHSIGFLVPSQADFSQMSLIVVAAVLGGFRTVWGPVIGALVVQGAAEILRSSPEFRLVIFAALLIIVLRIYPKGIMGAIEYLGVTMQTKRGKI